MSFLPADRLFDLVRVPGRRRSERRTDRESSPEKVLATFREEAAPHFEYVLQTLPEEELEAIRAVLQGRPPEPPAAEILERKGYLFAPSEGVFEPFSEEFRRFAGRFLRVDPKINHRA
jgi:hypothetical protein